MSSRDIATRIGHITDRAVRYRIDRLVKSHVIKLTAIVNADVIGLGITGDVTLRVEPAKSRQAATALAGLDWVSYLAAGPDGVVNMTVNAEDERSLANYLRRVLPRVDGIVGARLLLTPQLIKDIDTWAPPVSLFAGSHRASSRPSRSS